MLPTAEVVHKELASLTSSEQVVTEFEVYRDTAVPEEILNMLSISEKTNDIEHSSFNEASGIEEVAPEQQPLSAEPNVSPIFMSSEQVIVGDEDIQKDGLSEPWGAAEVVEESERLNPVVEDIYYEQEDTLEIKLSPGIEVGPVHETLQTIIIEAENRDMPAVELLFDTTDEERPIAIPESFFALQEQANEQPLEVTFTQLDKLLQTEVESEPRLQIALENVHEMIAESQIVENGEEHVELTPELTEALLVLLQELGYEKPDIALIEAVKRCGFQPLIEAVEQICLSGEARERPEIRIASSAMIVDFDDTVKQRVGRMLLGIVTKFKLEAAA